MRNLRNILFHCAPGEAAAPALARVAALARKSDAILTVAGVLEEIPRDLWMLVPPIGAGPVTEMAAAELLERLEQLVEPHRRRGIEIDTEVLLGDPCRELVRAIERRRHDLLVVGMGEQAMSRRNLVRLLKTAPCPVWIARPGVTAPAGSILAAVDPAPGKESSSPLSRRVMEAAGAIARLEAARLEVLCVWDAPLNGILSRWPRLPPEQLRETADRAYRSARTSVEGLLSELGLSGSPNCLHMRRGRLTCALADLARSKPVDLVVVGVTAPNRGRSWFSASGAEALLDRLPCSLLTVRQEAQYAPARQKAA